MVAKSKAEPGDAVRLDRWLWTARFFKTRSLAAAAAAGGKVHVGGTRAKRARLVHVGDELRIRKGPYQYVVIVRGLSEHRGPPADAAQLYEETAESRQARERLALELRAQPTFEFKGRGKPSKKERRMLDRWRTDR